MPPRTVWISFLIERPPSSRYEGSREHIARHGVTWQEVEQACLYGQPDETRWARGRLLVRGRTLGGRPLFCVLAPVSGDSEAYAVVTAYEEG